MINVGLAQARPNTITILEENSYWIVLLALITS